MKKLIIILLFSFLPEHGIGQHFENVLNIKNTPSKSDQEGLHAFFDLGSWMGFALNDEKNTIGFPGPYLLGIKHGVWASKAILSLDLINEEYESLINNKTEIANNFYPGKLSQIIRSNNIIIKSELIFNASESALIKFEITNSAKTKLTFKPIWSGEIFQDLGTISKSKREIKVQLQNQQFIIIKPIVSNNCVFETNKNRFTVSNNSISLKNGESISYYFQIIYHPDSTYKIAKIQKDDCPKIFIKNEKRWDNYLKISRDKKFSKTEKLVLVKSIITLINNWKSAAGALKHDGLFPSYHYKWFQGFWAWDSWKHAVALAKIDTELAKNQIRAMYDFQDKNGMIADCVFRDTLIEKHNWRDTKPPLSGWAIWEVYKASKDKSFLKELYPKLVKYHQFWYSYRDFDKDSICEYGSTDGSLIAAKWESGMDNAIRFDNTSIVKNSLYSLNTESVDLNSYLAKEKEFLSLIAKKLNLKLDSRKWLIEANSLKAHINRLFYNKSKDYYFDIEATSHTHLTSAYGPEGWTPLWCKIANPEQAEKVKNHILDEKKFNTHVPFPTIEFSHPSFNPQKGYWRGPVWLDQAWFGISGLKKYGFQKEAEVLKNKILTNAEGVSVIGKPLRENYHPNTGKGLNAHHFSWSAAHLILMITE